MFTEQTFEFLTKLEQNNDRAWFKQHQAEYEATVREPALAFISAMAPHISALSENMLALPKKVGGSLMRVQRDTRFSHNKAPYKTNVGIQFRHALGKDVHAPGFYLHLANNECFIAGGMWQPDSKALNAIRHCIDENPNSYLKTEQALLAAGFDMAGESLQRPPKGYSKDHPLLEQLKRKSHMAVLPLSKTQLCDTQLPELCRAHFQTMSPLLAYLCYALNLNY